jgi:RNA polymerase-binding transcription factor
MRKAFLKKARETLEEMRAQLLRNVQQDLNEVRDASKDEGMDTYDLASDARDKEINLILGDRDREKVQAIDEALSRVGDGSYGICESCESDIAEARLQALPFTRLCVNCQAERERELKMNRRFEEDRSFRRLSSSDGEDEGS